MNVVEKIEKMESKRTKNKDLVTIRKLADEMMPDHVSLHKIQVGGTNGKGSTSKWLSLMLKEAGYKTGVFTSPHLVCHTERISVDGKDISLEDWERIYDRYEDLFEAEDFSMFMMDAWMAVAYFLEQKVDVAIMEIGMGGQMDATTAFDYDAEVITNIGLEHQQYLGNTIEEIAATKGFIFKSGIGLTTETNPSALRIMKEIADHNHCPLTIVDAKAIYKDQRCYVEWNGILYPFDLPEYQVSNFYLALNTVHQLGIELTKTQIEKVIQSFEVKGRFTVLKEHPKIVIDGAHNIHGIRALVKSVKHWDGDIYFSVLEDKNATEMLEELEKLGAKIELVHFDSYRLYPLEKLGYPIIDMHTLEKRLQTTDRNTLLCGSLYFIGDVLKMEI